MQRSGNAEDETALEGEVQKTCSFVSLEPLGVAVLTKECAL